MEMKTKKKRQRQRKRRITESQRNNKMTTTTTTTAKISICQCQKIMENNNHHHHYNHGLLCHLIDNSNDNDHQQNPDNSTILYNTSIQSIFGSRYFQKQQQRQRQQQLFILPSSSSTATSISDHCFRFLSTTIIYFHHSLFIDLNISDQKRRKSFIHQPLLRQIQRKMWIRQQYLLLLSSLFLSVFCFGFVFSSITSPSSFTFSSIQNSNQKEDFNISGKQQQQQHSFVNDNVDYVMHSPRTVQTKYGALQGIVITFVRYNDDDDDKSSTSTSTSSNQNHNNSSSTSSIPPPPPQPIITLSPVEAF
ncbi:hypothetical protein HUG17_8396 [Dermatophagoides farinae]|uniref:Uncharacterized protein n=1 Tax=Dermatophagoides farinae TaxID=6954 RepID=A0A9D4SGD5_DERFA|nr:hypothetical protein HUG17_8396 [Dermatophagoides farinae]